MTPRRHRKEVILRDIENNLDINVQDDCHIDECNSYKNIYDTLCYFKKWISFNTMCKYKLTTTNINDMNKHEFSNLITSVINDNQKEMIQKSLHKLIINNIQIDYKKLKKILLNQNNHQLLASYIESTTNGVFSNKFQKHIIKQLLN